MRSTPPRFRDLTRDPLQGRRHGNATEGLEGAMLAVLVLLGLLAVAQAVVKDEEPAAVTGGCRTVSVDPVAGRAHREGSVVYDTAPPSSGDHSSTPLPTSAVLVARPAPADVVERAVHNLERGDVVIFYGQDVGDDDVRKVVAAAGAERLTKVLVVPWDRGAFDVGTSRFVLTAWGHRLPCDDPNADSILAFVRLYGGSSGTAPKKDAP